MQGINFLITFSDHELRDKHTLVVVVAQLRNIMGITLGVTHSQHPANTVSVSAFSAMSGSLSSSSRSAVSNGTLFASRGDLRTVYLCLHFGFVFSR